MIIDLTSSPEPEDSPARTRALAQFEPRKQKNPQEDATPTKPVNGLPCLDDNDYQRHKGRDGRHLEQNDSCPINRARPDANVVPLGSFAPTAPWEGLQHMAEHTYPAGPLAQGPRYGQQSHSNSTLNQAATARDPDHGTRPHTPLAHDQRQAFAKGDRSLGGRPLQVGQNNRQELQPFLHGGVREIQAGTLRIGLDRLTHLTASYAPLVEYAKPLDGLSPQALARLHEHRDSLTDTPLELALLRSQAPTSTSDHAARHARAQSGQSNATCPTCGRSITRDDNIQVHCQTCKACRSGLPHNAKAAQRQQTPTVGTGLGPPRATVTKGMSTEKPFNALKRSLPSPVSDHHESSTGTFKRAKVDLTFPQSPRHTRSRVQLVDMTDTTAEGVVYGDESKIPSPEPTSQHGPKDNSASAAAPQATDDLSRGPNRNGLPYSAEEDALLRKLKDVYKLPWPAITCRFSGRTQGSLTVHYYTKLRNGSSKPAKQSIIHSPLDLRPHAPEKRIRNSNIAEGMVSWASVKKARLDESLTVEGQRERNRKTRAKDQGEHEGISEREAGLFFSDDSGSEDDSSPQLPSQDSAYPSSMSRILRLRELGMQGRRAWSSKPHSVPDELKNHIFSGYALEREYQGTSGDVISLAWNDSERFAASSIAITDQQSMQYNMHRNLLVGDTSRGELEELLDHHIPRPIIDGAGTTNINASHSMRESQDPRLFLTVNAARFSPQDSTRLFTAGRDNTLRHFSVEEEKVAHQYSVEHPASVDLLSIGTGHGLVATGCHQATQNINVFQCHSQEYETKLQLSARQAIVRTYPSALRWGISAHHRNLLLAGFSSEEDIASNITGDTCLWDVTTGKQIYLSGVTRNVFDVTWNPIPSSSSIAFAVAGNANGHVVDKGMRSVIQCFAIGQQGGRSVLDWQCPALDINDIVFCPYDDNLVAAGATNGRVYIWDKRSADRSQRPLHTLKHGESLNVLDHDRHAEVADTGVQFLSWGSTKTRLFSGSSDGVVKTWNPYRSPQRAHISDISGPARDRSAVMSGAFSPDYQQLLIGTENGRINLFKSGINGVHLRPQKFKIRPAPGPEQGEQQQGPFAAAQSLLETGQIELRPCGAMPFRQAVQGPNYAGPFLKPSKTLRRDAQTRLDSARLAQARLVDDNIENDSAKAASEVQIAEASVMDLQGRKAFAAIAKPKAKAFQRELAEAEKNRQELEALVGSVERCKLDCAVLPRTGDGDDKEVEDSGQSELRIPGFLRYLAGASAEELEHKESTSTCSACYPMKSRVWPKKHDFSTACIARTARLSSACTRCGKGSKPDLDEGTPAVCGRCSFGCFRCGQGVVISEDSLSMSCRFCRLEWEMGVLGFELVGSSFSLVAPSVKMQISSIGDDDENGQMQELGDEDREYHAARWDALGS